MKKKKKQKWKKKTKHTTVIFRLAKKIQNFIFLQIGAWNLQNKVLWYAESDGVIFIKILWLLRVYSPFLENKANILGLVAFDG